jgi:signal transduction histidine kinase
VDGTTIRAAARGERSRQDVGHLYPPAADPYRVVTSRVETAQGPLVVATAISKHKHDEALRELLLQLAIADLATLAAASAVGYGTARAALNPVERYRRAAEEAVAAPVLPVDPSRDDEVTRLGHTFNALLDRVAQANARERQFLADASHELRSPLALMRTEIEVALLRPRSETEQDAFSSLRGQVERLIDLSNALLDLEELRGSDHLALAEVEVADLLEDTASHYRSTVADAGRRLATSAPSALTVRWQPRWLDLALGNLVSNALRHGRGTITVAAVLVEGTGDRQVELSVCDEGPGFPEDFVDRAFDRFARAEASRSTPGTGLGLALVHAVATAHRGTVAITGPSTVTLRLPVDPDGAA